MRKRLIWRLCEMLPGAAIWFTLVGAIVLSFIRPLWAMLFIIAFDLYWLLRVIYFVFYLALSWWRYQREIQIDWHARLQQEYPDTERSVRHLIFLPTYKEPIEVIRKTLDALVTSVYDRKKFIIILAGEARDDQNFRRTSEQLKRDFRDVFLDFLVTVHPCDRVGEIAGKGSNLHYAGWEVKKYVDSKKMPYDQLIVSSFDVDTIVHPQYFAYLTHVWASSPDRLRVSYQPVALYNNNIWESNPVVRVASFGTTFWLFTDLARPERLFTFSSQSMSWQMLVDVGFWERTIVTEDSRVFLQGLIRYDGMYRVQPLYLPVSMNTVMVDSHVRSLINLYKQQRRWAWGVEHLPYMIWNFFFVKNHIPFRTKMHYIWNLGEGMYSWATAPIIIFILGYLPLLNAGVDLRNSALYYNTPNVLAVLLRLSMVGIFLSAILSLLLLPPRPDKRHPIKAAWLLVQWAMLPVTLIFFGSIPAIDAQTRLMIGKPLGFWVTEKK